MVRDELQTDQQQRDKRKLFKDVELIYILIALGGSQFSILIHWLMHITNFLERHEVIGNRYHLI